MKFLHSNPEEGHLDVRPQVAHGRETEAEPSSALMVLMVYLNKPTPIVGPLKTLYRVTYQEPTKTMGSGWLR